MAVSYGYVECPVLVLKPSPMSWFCPVWQNQGQVTEWHIQVHADSNLSVPRGLFSILYAVFSFCPASRTLSASSGKLWMSQWFCVLSDASSALPYLALCPGSWDLFICPLASSRCQRKVGGFISTAFRSSHGFPGGCALGNGWDPGQVALLHGHSPYWVPTKLLPPICSESGVRKASHVAALKGSCSAPFSCPHSVQTLFS